jgi:hypothetical protein
VNKNVFVVIKLRKQVIGKRKTDDIDYCKDPVIRKENIDFY